MFIQLNTRFVEETDQWREVSRWVKYQENVEDGGKRWKQLAAMSTPRSSHTCEVMDGLIYVVGGGDGKDWLCSAEVEIF